MTANPTIATATFEVPEKFRTAALASANTDVPYQWVLRRMFLGRLLDSDAVYFPPGGGFKLVELAPNVQHVVGGSANNLIVAMRDGLVIFDAPVNEGQSRWVIDAAKQKYPGKNITHLVLTHHHMDHTGGMRTYVAEGATVIVPTPTKAYFEQVVKAPHVVSPDELQKQTRAATILEVNETMTLKDDTIQINLHNIPNPHSEGMLIGHVVRENIVWVTDLVSPRGPIARNGGDRGGRQCLAEAQHHRRDHRRRPWHHRQAGGGPGRAGGELATSVIPGRAHKPASPESITTTAAYGFPGSAALYASRPGMTTERFAQY